LKIKLISLFNISIPIKTKNTSAIILHISKVKILHTNQTLTIILNQTASQND
jgi:hypothetical protein